MNHKRRVKLQKALDLLDEVISDEQDAYDNMPENLQESDKGDKVADGLDELNEAKDILKESLA